MKVSKMKVSTMKIHEALQSSDYTRQPVREITNGNKQNTKTLILARHGMLECGSNFKGTMPDLCKNCEKKDNENHRLNECSMFKETNWYNSSEKIDFCDIYSNDNDILAPIIKRLENVWEFRFANGKMKKT